MGRCAEAMYEVAQCYLTGEGTNYDPKESIYWMHQARIKVFHRPNMLSDVVMRSGVLFRKITTKH